MITTIGLDLAKNVFQVHGVDERGFAVLRKQLKRDQVAPFFARLEPCLIGIEACGGAHHWAAKLTALGHRVKMMAPQFVKPYVKTNKNDSLDAEAICEAVARPNMRFVPAKSPEQQSVVSLHTARESFVHARTAQANQIRGLLIEFGLIIPQGMRHLYERVPGLIEDASDYLPGRFRLLIDRLFQHLKELDRQVQELECEIQQWHRSSAAARSAAGWRRFQESAPSPPVRWPPARVTRATSRMHGSSPPGSGWCRIRIPAAARPSCWASANAAMSICELC